MDYRSNILWNDVLVIFGYRFGVDRGSMFCIDNFGFFFSVRRLF